MLAGDVRLYKGTPAWELAKAVKEEDTSKIKNIIAKDGKLINYQEPKFKQPLLEWAVYTDRFKSATMLAELGADPNLQDLSGTSAFIQASDNYETSDYVKLLLKHGGNVNAVANAKEQRLRTPLIAASFNRLESVKLLVDAGADINYRSSEDESALKSAWVGNQIEVLHFLIIDKKADYKKAIGYDANRTPYYLQEWVEKMDFSKEPNKEGIKKEILDYMKTH